MNTHDVTVFLLGVATGAASGVTVLILAAIRGAQKRKR